MTQRGQFRMAFDIYRGPPVRPVLQPPMMMAGPPRQRWLDFTVTLFLHLTLPGGGST